MTGREHRLRKRIDTLTDERDELRKVVFGRERRLFHRCLYCGRRCPGRTCPAHRDLIALDPNYTVRAA